MATRFYFDPNGLPSITPSANSGWEQTSAMVRRLMSPQVPIGSGAPEIAFTDTETSSSNVFDVCLVQFISPPLAAQTLLAAGTARGQVRMAETVDVNADIFPRVIGSVFSGDGLTLRQKIKDTVGSTECVLTTLTNNANCQSTSLSGADLAVVDGDIIVLEWGFRATNAVATPYACNMSIGNGATSDLPVDTVTTTALNPWFEFSQDLVFLSSPGSTLNAVREFTSQVVSVTGAANTATTLRLPGVFGCRHAIDSIFVKRANNSAAAVTGNATLIISSLNIPGNICWGVGNAMAAGATQTDIKEKFGRYKLLSLRPGTDTYLTFPSAGANVVWTATIAYKLVASL